MRTLKYILLNSKVQKTTQATQRLNQYITNNNISLTDTVNINLVNPYELNYTVKNLEDCIKLLEFSFSLEQFNLTLDATNLKTYTNLPTIHLTHYDEVGDDFKAELPTITSHSHLAKSNQCSNKFNLIVGNSKEAVIDSFVKIVELINKANKNNQTDIYLGLFLGQINPSKYFNRSFKLSRAKILYENFVRNYNKSKNSSLIRFYINIIQGVLSCVTKLENININYTKTKFTPTLTKVKQSDIEESITNNHYFYTENNYLKRLNIDLLPTSIPLQTLQYTNLVSLYQSHCYDTKNIVYVTNSTLIVSQKGVIAAEKVNKNSYKIWLKDNWYNVNSEQIKELKEVYIILFTDGSSIETIAEATYKVKTIEEDEKIKYITKSTLELTKNDCLLCLDLLPDNVRNDAFICNGIVAKVIKGNCQNKVIKLSIESKLSSDIVLSNSIQLTSVKKESKYISEAQINARLTNIYNELLIQDYILLSPTVDLTKFNVININEQLDIFNKASILAGSTLSLKEFNLCPRLLDNLAYNTIVNVCISGIYSFYEKLTEIDFFVDSDDLSLYQSIDSVSKKYLISNSIDELFNLHGGTIYLTKQSKKLSYTGKLQLNNLIFISFLELWKKEVANTISHYCTKYNLPTPKKTTSIKELGASNLSALTQLDLGVLAHSHYSTFRSLIMINYTKSELPKISRFIKDKLSSNVELPFLYFRNTDVS